MYLTLQAFDDYRAASSVALRDLFPHVKDTNVAVDRPQDWVNEFGRIAHEIARGAGAAAPIVGVSSANVDHVYFVDSQRLGALVAATADKASDAFATTARAVIDRVERGRGGTITQVWPQGAELFGNLLGGPDRVQVGGTVPQAAWALSELGAPTRVALEDRSRSQLDVLDARIGIVEGSRVVSAGDAQRSDAAGKPPHIVLEFTEGVSAGELTVRRSTRLVLLFGRYGIECDAQFDVAARSGLLDGPRAALVSGLAFADFTSPHDFEWILDHTRALRAAGIDVVHHELTEFPDEESRQRTLDAVAANSVGANLSELPIVGEIEASAIALAERAGAERVVVHADDWAMTVHRGDPRYERDALLCAVLLASARAGAGAPTADLALAGQATFATDIPRDASLHDGWRSTVVPSPYLRKPSATVGLGDTFCAGLLLHASL